MRSIGRPAMPGRPVPAEAEQLRFPGWGTGSFQIIAAWGLEHPTKAPLVLICPSVVAWLFAFTWFGWQKNNVRVKLLMQGWIKIQSRYSWLIRHFISTESSVLITVDISLAVQDDSIFVKTNVKTGNSNWPNQKQLEVSFNGKQFHIIHYLMWKLDEITFTSHQASVADAWIYNSKAAFNTTLTADGYC